MVKKIFNKNKFLTETIAFGTLHTSMICVVLVPYFKDSGMLPLQLSALLLIKKVGRLLFDSLFGLLFDRFGAKKIFLIGRIMKLISFIVLLAEPSFTTFAISMLFDGISYGSIYGKIGAYIYNTLSANNKLSAYPRAMSIYYFSTSALLSTLSFVASILLKHYGYNLLVIISIILNITSIIILLFVVPNNKDKRMQKFVSKSFVEIVKLVYIVAKEKPEFLYLLLFYGITNFFSWQFGSISSMVLLDMGLDNANVVRIGAICKIALAIGSIISMFCFKNGIKIKYCTNLFTLFVVAGLSTSFLYNKYMLTFLMCIVVVAYTTIEVSIEKNLDKVSNPKIRGTAVSLAMTFCNIFTMSSFALTGFIAQYCSYKIALLVLLSIIFIIALILKIKLKKLE